jgi:hypothetical protein
MNNFIEWFAENETSEELQLAYHQYLLDISDVTDETEEHPDTYRDWCHAYWQNLLDK